ncbi:MAG: protein of unknown function DUF669 [Podoviridae sp. cty5g4]|nr:MAG: protein of unknown function DUF669 [Podoviridae sp. cty5g4]
MNFRPMKDDEVSNSYVTILAPAGEYDFVVKKAVDSVSKSGNEMIKLEIEIHPIEGKIKVYDYLLEAMSFKLKHFCDAVGLTKEYESGSITAAMCSGRAGRCLIDIEVDKTGTYHDKNVVKDYCKADVDLSDVPF